MIDMRVSEAAEALDVPPPRLDATFIGCSTDSRSSDENQLFVALRGPNFDGHEFVDAATTRGAGAVMVDHPTSDALPELLVEDTRVSLGRLAGVWRDRFSLPIAAVTGSNGKTTVKEMLASILAVEGPVLATQGNLNNDVGVPLTLMRIGPEDRYAVVELGANHVGEIAGLTRLAKPHVGVITLCAPAHLEGFGSLDAVAHAKGELLQQLRPEGTAIINADDDYADLWREFAGTRQRLTFGLKNTADVSATWCSENERTRLVLLTPAGTAEACLKLPGRHNVLNALAAVGAALALGVSLTSITTGLSRVQPMRGRLSSVKVGDIRIIDDTYNANPASLKAGLEVMATCCGEHWLVLGDMAELGTGTGGFHQEAGALAREYGVERLYATGESARLAVEAFGDGGEHFECQEDLINALRSTLCGGVCLLVKGSRSMAMERVVTALTETM